MITMYTKVQLQAIVDAMSDDPDDVLLGDFWSRENACEFAGKPVMSLAQWHEFGKWYSQDSSGLSADIVDYIEAFKPMEG